jgi:GDP/UDP-N,N'-diacetylbacillosamine 2-epimerase (hydrolysing)
MKKICFVTGSRADYGLLSHLMKSVEKDKNLKLQVIVTGSHLSKKFGNTKKEIENDKIKIDKKIDILSKNDSPIDILKNTSIAIKKISLAINQLKPELVILLGDRYEIFSAAISAYFMRIPIAHFHGGEVTEGAIDESIRHSISKMASLHLVSSLLHKKRLIQLGENKMNIHNVGALGIDVIKNTKLISKELLGRKLKIKFQKKIIVITFHPVTLENNTSEEQINEIFKSFKNIKNTTYIFTLPNADMYGNIIIKLIETFCKKYKNAFYYKSLGKTNFYSLINISNLFMGNSSSGIIEVPYFKKPIINIGDRQKGRLQSKTIINCKPESKAIIKAIKLSQSAEYISLLNKSSNPYEKKSTTLMSLKFIKEKINKLSVKKKFYDIKF